MAGPRKEVNAAGRAVRLTAPGKAATNPRTRLLDLPDGSSSGPKPARSKPQEAAVSSPQWEKDLRQKTMSPAERKKDEARKAFRKSRGLNY